MCFFCIVDQLYSLNVGVPDNSNYDWNTLPMVIGASGNHYREALAAVDAHHRMFPNNVIYYYDLGLTWKQVKSVSSTEKEIGIGVLGIGVLGIGVRGIGVGG